MKSPSEIKKAPDSASRAGDRYHSSRRVHAGPPSSPQIKCSQLEFLLSSSRSHCLTPRRQQCSGYLVLLYLKPSLLQDVLVRLQIQLWVPFSPRGKRISSLKSYLLASSHQGLARKPKYLSNRMCFIHTLPITLFIYLFCVIVWFKSIIKYFNWITTYGRLKCFALQLKLKDN